MQTQFLFRHMESSDALRSYAEDRLAKIERYFADPIKVSCTFEVAKIQHIASFDVTLRNGLQLHASESTENMYSSVDMALAKMERQVRRYKDRITNHKPSKGKVAKIRQLVFSEAQAAAKVDTDSPPPEKLPEMPAYTVVRCKESRAERLTVDEAIMQMNLLHRSFLVFTNRSTDHINVVYTRADRSFGLIETQGHVDTSES